MAFIRHSRLRHLLLFVQLLSQGSTSQLQTQRFSNGTCFWGIDGSPFALGLGTCPLPINEKTAFRTGSWSPWSHRPNCNVPMDKNSPQYCLFTDDTFRGGHGISILTTADIAASVADALDDSSVPPSIRGFPVVGMDAAPYEIVDIPGRGKGTIATRKIKALETVIVAHPAVLTINNIEGASYEEIMGLLQRAVDQLPSQERESVYSLAQSNGDASPIQDVIWTNSYGLDIGGARHMAVFPISSRMNHDCRPNTFYRLLPQTLAQQVIAVRDIEAGEELTHSYTGHGMPYEERKSRLNEWNFNCTCSLCTAPSKERARSDRRRYRLRDILTELNTYAAGAKKLGKMLDETLDMVKKEDMWFLVGNFYASFAWAYLVSSDFESARKNGILAEELAERYGQEDGVSQLMENFWQTLKDKTDLKR